MVKIFRRLLTIIVVLGILTGCGDSASEEDKDIIYTTIYPLQYLVEEIAGDIVDVESVYPPGVDEHTYEPTAQELTQIADGEAFFYIGAGLEALASTAAEALENQDVQLIEIGEHEELFLSGPDQHHENDEHDDHHHGDHDPHLWLDPLRMIEMAEIIKDELIKIYPDEIDRFEENLNGLEENLTALDNEFEELIATKNNKQILVTHAAFGYWEERYGIEQISIHGISTENEPSQKELITIVEAAEENNVEHIIFEQNVTTRVAEIIQDEIGAEARIIHNLAVLTEEDISEGRDYISIMRDNLDVLDEVMQ